MLAASAMAGEELYYHGKNYIMSLFMESIYMHQKYWQHLKHIDLDKERTFRHLRCLEEYVIKTDRKLRNLRPSMEEDLCQLPGPVTEESVCRHLYHRFERHQYHTFLGSTLIALNPHTHRLPYKALHCNKGLSRNLRLLVTKVLHQVAELRQSHSVVVSGETGSGKTRTFMELLRHLYDQAGGGQETDTFKVISAAVTALRPFDTTATIANQESSRSCWSIECAVSNRAIASAHLTLHSLSYNRLTERPTVERCYDVFYMILAGMSEEEKVKYHLSGQSTESLAYLSSLDVLRKSTSSRRYREKYTLWKEALAMLGIPHTEILEILSAILLLGNIVFVQGEEQELAVTGNSPLHSAAKLLKIPADKLLRCLTTQLVPVRGKSALFTNTIQQANTRRNTLAQSLYGRLFQYLVNKINQSTESRAAHPRASSQSGNHHSGSSVTNTVNVIDCIGFQNVQGTQLEQLCGNICSEAIQHFYNMSTFHEILDSFDEEKIMLQSSIRWYDNSATIQLLSQKNMGLISLLYFESKEHQPAPHSLIKKIDKVHGHSDSLEIDKSGNQFTVHHFGGKITYNCEILLLEDKNSMPDEMVALFGKKGVTSSLLSKLYSRELKDLEANGGKAKGYSYCAVPCPSIGYNMQPGCYGQDFLYSLDCLMQTLAFSNTTFVRCIKASESGTPHLWDAEYVHRQVVMLEVLETTKLLTSGLPHKLSYKDFVHKYQCISKLRLRPPSWTLEHYREFTQDIIDQYLQELESKSIPYQTSSWVFGKKHIFLSDDFSRQLDMLLNDVRVKSACKIQAAFRGWLIRDSWQGIIEHRRTHRRGGKGKVPQAYDSGYNTPLSHRLPHPKPPTSQPIDNYNLYSKNTDHLFHWKPTFKNMQDMGTPPLPDKRKYSISRGMKVYFPQVRVMKENINVEGYELKENSEVLCVGYSSRPSHVSIAFQNDILEVPFEKTSIRITNQLHGPELQKL